MHNLFSLESFSIFSSQHLLILAIFSLITILLGWYAYYLKGLPQIYRITKVLIGITIIQEILDYLNRYLNGQLFLSVDLPFHICNYVLFLSVIGLYNRNKYVFNFCYFNAFSGALVANITPDTNGVVGDIGLFFFFLHHFLILINVIWMIFGFGLTPSFKGLLATVLFLNVASIPIGLLNYILDANYMYLCAKPPVDNALLVGEWPIYILAMELIGGLIFVLLLTPFKIKKQIFG